MRSIPASGVFTLATLAFALGLAAGPAFGGTKLDKKFGSGGKVSTTFGEFTRASAVALQEDGKVVAAGFTASSSMSGYDYDFAVARYDTDGSQDTGFGGGDGQVTTDFGTTADIATAVAIQPSDGKIVVAGYSNFVMALARYETDGSPDMDFGTDGKVTFLIDSNCKATAVAIQPLDEKIVVAGNAFTGGGNNFALARFETDGDPDGTFGSGGGVSIHFTALPVELGNALALDEDGRIVVAGQAYSNLDGTLNDFLVARYDDEGDPDPTFGSGGFRQIDFNPNEEAARAVAIQRDGMIVAAGFTYQNNTGDFAVARLDTNGDLDPAFGTGGKQTTDFAAGPGNGDQASAVLIQPGNTLADDKIVLAGSAFIGANYDFALARYTSTGVLDKKFGKKGKLVTALGPGDTSDGIGALVRQSDGMLVAAGGSSVGGGSSTSFALTRYKTK
jgi:uncharacterized delta-60 repeat protein